MKEVQQSMQTMFKQMHQHHCLGDDSDIDESHQVEVIEDITVSECFNLSDLHQPPTKKTKTQHFAPITTAVLGTHLGKSSIHKLRVLFDSGSSGSIIVAKFIKIYIWKMTPKQSVVDKRRNLLHLRQVHNELHFK